jgi:peroxiredoxin
LQGHLADFEREGVAIFAISYDSVAVLESFAERRGITYPLLSDEGSQTIRALGLLNTHVEEQSRFYGITPRDEHQGVPYPGLFLIGTDGTIIEKRFEQSYRHRPVAALVLDEVLGVSEPAPAVTARAELDGVQVVAWVDAPAYRPYQKLGLHLAFQLSPDIHVYASPTPEGYIPLTVEIAPFEGLSVWPLAAPEPQPFQVEGLDETFLVYEGQFRVSLPFSIDQAAGDVSLDIRVGYQACTATECFPPDVLSLTLDLAGEALIRD